jgi:hypothetical protein
MAVKSKIMLEKLKKAQNFVWEPIEGYNLELRFFTGTSFKPKI